MLQGYVCIFFDSFEEIMPYQPKSPQGKMRNLSDKRMNASGGLLLRNPQSGNACIASIESVSILTLRSS